MAAHIRGAKAVLEIHGRAQAVHFRSKEHAGQGAFEEALIIAPRGVTGGGGAAIAGGNKFQSLRLGRAHAAGQPGAALRARPDAPHGANAASLLPPPPAYPS